MNTSLARPEAIGQAHQRSIGKSHHDARNRRQQSGSNAITPSRQARPITRAFVSQTSEGRHAGMIQ